RDSSAQLAAYLARAATLEPIYLQQDIAETSELLGANFDHWEPADAALEKFVVTAGPENDVRLIPLFYRRMQRQMELLQPFLSRVDIAPTMKSFADLVGSSK